MARSKQGRGRTSTWVKQVLIRDEATCQHCGDKDVPLVAHHLLSFEDFPEHRLDVDNGLTLCNPCHYKEHDWVLTEAGIRSLVDSRGIETRRWVGECLWCDTFLVKQASDMRRPDGSYRTYGFCNKKCAAKANGYAREGVPGYQVKGLKVSKIFEQWVVQKKKLEFK